MVLFDVKCIILKSIHKSWKEEQTYSCLELIDLNIYNLTIQIIVFAKLAKEEEEEEQEEQEEAMNVKCNMTN